MLDTTRWKEIFVLRRTGPCELSAYGGLERFNYIPRRYIILSLNAGIYGTLWA